MVGAFRRGEDKVDLPDRPQQLDSGALVEGGFDGERVREICGECQDAINPSRPAPELPLLSLETPIIPAATVCTRSLDEIEETAGVAETPPAAESLTYRPGLSVYELGLERDLWP
jgi:hypothetical protein